MQRRTWRWWIAGSIVFALGGLGLAYAEAPALIARHLDRRLPLDLGHRQVMTSVSTSPLPGASQMTLRLAPGRARRLANSIDGIWVPPGLIRSGATSIGTGRLPHDLVNYSWRVAIESAATRPVLAIRLTREEANDLFDPYRRIPIDRDRGIVLTYVIDDAAIHDDDQTGQTRYQRRLRIDAVGVMTFHLKSLHVDVPIRHLVGHLDWNFRPAGGRLIPACTVTVDSVDADMPPIPFMPSSDRIWRKLESSLTRSLTKHLARHPLPGGAPIEALVDVQIGNGAQAPPILPRIAHPLAEL
ncbi:MAG: hypothetical protein H0W83_02965 [Planctomycetes bacterium]|nr:hypothetical protein [Planctomycetota bacterium]